MSTTLSLPPGQEKSAKLLRLALDRAATEPEAVSAFSLFRRRVLGDGSAEFWLTPDRRAPVIDDPGPRMPFGKHRGRLIRDIAREDRPYLLWLAPLAREPLRGKIYDALEAAARARQQP